MPFIPGFNTDEENLRATGEFLRGVKGVVKLNLLPYHNAAEDKHNRWAMDFKLRGAHAPTENSLRKAAEIFEKYGIKTEIGG
jgi:pyruvate formate lyase activating enzyme